jgi:nitrate reductase NapE component
MGYAAGLCATAGDRPRVSVKQLVRPMLVLAAVVGVVTAVAGFSVWRHAEMMDVTLSSGYDQLIPPHRHRAAFTVACYHFVAYASAVIGSVGMCVWITRRRRAAASPPAPAPP